MKHYQQLLKDIHTIMVDCAVKGDFDGCDMNGFDMDKFRPAFRKHEQRLKDEAITFSMHENHDDPSVYGKKMVPLSLALGKY